MESAWILYDILRTLELREEPKISVKRISSGRLALSWPQLLIADPVCLPLA